MRGRVIQLLPTLAYGDGVGNDALAIYDILLRNGFDTKIYAMDINKRISEQVALPVSEMPVLTEEDIIIYHLSVGSRLNELLATLNGKKIIRYHNVTPPEFFLPYSKQLAGLCQEGISAVKMLSTVPDYCLADSEYNKKDLLDAGYRCEISVLPIIIPFADYKKQPNGKIVSKYNDGHTNILFTGRIVPNKKQEDIILAFYHYQKYYNPKSRLFLVGSYVGMENYFERLRQFADTLGVKNVIFTGHIKFDEILAYYKVADLFLCMSEHEGFCIPLVEAMLFDVPIVAYQGSGVAGTLKGSAFPVYEKNPLETAGIIDHICRNRNIKQQLIKTQHERLKDFDNKKIEEQFLTYLKRCMNL